VLHLPTAIDVHLVTLVASNCVNFGASPLRLGSNWHAVLQVQQQLAQLQAAADAHSSNISGEARML